MSLATVVVHESQFPGRVREQLLKSLRRREIQQKFHYGTLKQAQKWLALHEALSPARSDSGFGATYNRAFQATLGAVDNPEVHVIGLGCGGGEKDVRLLEALGRSGKRLLYTPVDVSVPIVLTAREAALKVLGPDNCFPVVCDLPGVVDWEGILPSVDAQLPRVITFFGMMPTLSPAEVLPQLSRLVRPQDQLLLSANLAPGSHYSEGVAQVLPQYDNPLTRDWLMTFLVDVGFESSDGRLVFGVEENPAGSGLLRIQAVFHLDCPRRIRVEGETFDFAAGEQVRVFFSYRHTPGLVRELLAGHDLSVSNDWIADSGEEGVFLVRRTAHG